MNLLKWSLPIVLGVALVTPVVSGRAANGGTQIGVKDRANAYASIDARGQFVALTWGATTKAGAIDIYVAVSRDGGRAFAPPARVNGVAGDASLSGEQPPQIVLIPRADRDPSIVVMWTSKAPAGTKLLTARSDDGGKSFAASGPVSGSEAPGNRGWESIAASRDGGVVAVWLDHRELAAGRGSAGAMNHSEHQHVASGQRPSDGVARALLSRLWFARLGTDDRSRTLTGGVCYCCKTAIATDASGAIYTAWRHVYDGNIRDIAFTKSSDSGRTFAPPVRVSDDNWVLDGCPENGPALIVDRAKRIHIVWPTLVPAATSTSEPTMELFYAMSEDGRRFTTRQRIPTVGVPRHPQMTLGANDELLVAWDEQARGTRHVAVARGTIDARGKARFVRQPVGDGVRAEYPVLSTVDDGTIVAWTSGAVGQTTLRVERLVN